MTTISRDEREGIELIADRMKETTIAQQKAKMETYIALTLRGLPIPQDLLEECESALYSEPEAPVELQEGDILHVKLGITAEEMGGASSVPWIPHPDDMAAAKAEWEQIVPDGVKVIVTHFGTETSIIPARGYDVEIELTDEAAEFFGLDDE